MGVKRNGLHIKRRFYKIIHHEFKMGNRVVEAIFESLMWQAFAWGYKKWKAHLKLGSVYLDRDTKIISIVKKARGQAGKLRSISRPRCWPITYIVYKLEKTDLVFKEFTKKKVFKIQRYKQYGGLYSALRKIPPVV